MPETRLPFGAVASSAINQSIRHRSSDKLLGRCSVKMMRGFCRVAVFVEDLRVAVITIELNGDQAKLLWSHLRFESNVNLEEGSCTKNR